MSASVWSNIIHRIHIKWTKNDLVDMDGRLIFLLVKPDETIYKYKVVNLNDGITFMDINSYKFSYGKLYVYLNSASDINLLIKETINTRDQVGRFLSGNSIPNHSAEPVNCESEWQNEGACTVPCGWGKQDQTYRHTKLSANGGRQCPIPDYGDSRQVDCKIEDC
jgi:hypothetical protein